MTGPLCPTALSSAHVLDTVLTVAVNASFPEDAVARRVLDD